MKKYVVRWVVEGFIERETFLKKIEAKKYMKKIRKEFKNYLQEIDFIIMDEINVNL